MTFRSFDSIEDANAFLRKQEEIANITAGVQPWQHALGRGQYCVRTEDNGLVVFSYIPTREEVEASERECGSGGEELEYTLRTLDSADRRGHLYGRHYSTVEPEGEWGSVHRSLVLPLSRELFEEAKAAGWAVDTEYLIRAATHVEQVCRG